MSLRGPFEGSLITTGEPFNEAELKERSCDQRQLEISRQMTRLVDVLYALVLAQGAVAYRSLFTIPQEFHSFSRCLPVVLALVLIYFTAIQSFIDYHLASEDQPYRLLDLTKRWYDLRRFYLDVVIVGFYSFLLLKCHVLIDSPDADLTLAFFALPAIFALYFVWGAFRRRTGAAIEGEEPYSYRLLLLCLFLYLLLAGLYTQFSTGWVVNSAFLFTALFLMLFYRCLNWPQNRSCSNAGANSSEEAATAP